MVDHKTADRAYSEQQIAGDLQMLIYAAAVKQLDVVEGRDVMLRFDVLTKSKKPKFLLLLKKHFSLSACLSWQPFA